MPQGFCIPPVCWDLVYNFNNVNIFLISAKNAAAGNWNKRFNQALNAFPVEVAAIQQALNAQARFGCDTDCVCVRLHPNAVNFQLAPQKIGQGPAGPMGALDLYMEGITATGFFGVCAAKGWVKVKKGNKWIPVEDLGAADILTPPKYSPAPPPSGSGGKKSGKKGKKGKKKPRR